MTFHKKTLMSKLYGSVKSLLSGIGFLEWQLEGQNNFIHMILTVIISPLSSQALLEKDRAG